MTTDVTELDKLNCAQRELNLRRRVYPRLVEQGKMTQLQADRELRLMQAILIDYTAVVKGERLI